MATALVGSDKQVAWAERIRSEAFTQLDTLESKVVDVSKAAPALAQARKTLSSIDKASVWIDLIRHHVAGNGLLRLCCKPEGQSQLAEYGVQS